MAIVRSLKRSVRFGARALPKPWRVALGDRARRRLARLRRPARWGTLRRCHPLSDDWGSDRGTPVDRTFFDRFLRNHAHLIRGRVLEILDDTYSRTYGGTNVTSTLVVDIDGTNPRADLVVDLCTPGALRGEQVDTIVLTQTIGLLPDSTTALVNFWGALRPGGVMLITNNVVGRVVPADQGVDVVRHTPLGLRLTVERVLPDALVDEHGFGNLVTSIALLHGISAEELTGEELSFCDPTFPTSCAVVVRKPDA
jgi:hypothetical protein